MTEAVDTDVPASPLAAVREITRALLAGEEPGDVLRLVAFHARRLVRADLASISVPTADDPRTLVVRVAVGQGASRVLGTRFPLDASLAGLVMRTWRTEAVEDAGSDPRASHAVVALGRFGPALAVPLIARGQPIGALWVANRRGGRMFGAHDLDVVDTFAAQASLVLDTVRAEEELERLLAVEDLHDTVIQRLFATGMTLEAARAAALPPAAAAQVARALDDLDVTIREIRATVFPGTHGT